MSFVSCSEDDGSDYIFKTVISENPKNLDPLLAEDKSSLMIIENCFEGLLYRNEKGEISNGCAESYEISPDELVYTFHLKDDIYWHTLGESEEKFQLTADDFLFAFERIFDPLNPISPYRDDFLMILGAKKIANGEEDFSKLGVYVIDDFTIKFRLEEKCYDFLNLLTTSAALPCNREFFKSTKGRYGLFAETTASNGAFYVKEWNFDPYWDENFIIMRRNDGYKTSRIYPLGLNFFIKKGDEFPNFLDGDYHCISSDFPQDFHKGGIETERFQTSVYGAFFNAKSELFSNANIKKSFVYSINRELISSENLQNVSISTGIIPNSVYMVGKKYRESVSDAQFSFYEPIKASNLWYDELEHYENDEKISCRILMLDGEFTAEMLENYSSQWEKNLGISCKIEAVSEKEYNLKLSDGDYDILIAEVSSEKNSPEDFLESVVEFANYNSLSFNYADVNSEILKLEETASVSDALDIISKTEKDIIYNGDFIPLYYSYDYFYTDSSAENIVYFPLNGKINFKNAIVIK